MYVALLYGYNPMYTPLVCVYSLHAFFILRNTTYLHTHTVDPHMFLLLEKCPKRKDRVR